MNKFIKNHIGQLKPSATLAINEESNRLKKSGKKVYKFGFGQSPIPIPESIMSAVCHFPNVESAVITAQEIIQYGIPIARIELLNKDQMEISINYSNLENMEKKPTLFLEFHGSEASNKESIQIAEEISDILLSVLDENIADGYRV